MINRYKRIPIFRSRSLGGNRSAWRKPITAGMESNRQTKLIYNHLLVALVKGNCSSNQDGSKQESQDIVGPTIQVQNELIIFNYFSAYMYTNLLDNLVTVVILLVKCTKLHHDQK